jgi:hypothetical protein
MGLLWLKGDGNDRQVPLLEQARGEKTNDARGIALARCEEDGRRRWVSGKVLSGLGQATLEQLASGAIDLLELLGERGGRGRIARHQQLQGRKS